MKKEQLLDLINDGKSYREIGEITGKTKSVVRTLVNKFELNKNLKFKKNPKIILNQINTKEWAYLIGFIAADAAIVNEKIEISLFKEDIELLNFISTLLECNIHIDNTLNIKTRRFPRVRLTRQITGLSKFLSGNLKVNRNLPILSKTLEKYMVLGVFDADGCITWGRRKDRDRLWHKVSFTSQLNILICVQKILYTLNISTTIKPKSNEKCFVLEFANKKDILTFYNWLYSDLTFIPLKRKFNKFNALRLELGEFGETTINSTIPSRAIDHSIEGVETTGGKMDFLNNQQENPSLILNKVRYSPNRAH